MEIPLNPLGDNPEGPVAPVDPADLRSVWEMLREVQARRPGAHFIISDEMYKRVCSPGADVGAVWFRASIIRVLDMLGMLKPWINEGVVADAVFKVAATFPMNGMATGVPRQELPFDVQEFMSQVASSAGQYVLRRQRGLPGVDGLHIEVRQNLSRMPMEWNLYYPSWMIADGEPDHDVGESFEWFAVEFWTEEPLVKKGVRQKTAVPIADYKYRITGEITFLSEKACVIDFGLKAIRTSDLVARDCKVGDYVAGEISIGLPLCVEMVPESVLETLKYKWKVNGISADLTPFTPQPGNPRLLIRDTARIQYVDAKSTREVRANNYILRCTEIK